MRNFLNSTRAREGPIRWPKEPEFWHQYAQGGRCLLQSIKKGAFPRFFGLRHISIAIRAGLIFDYKKGKWAFEGRDFPIL